MAMTVILLAIPQLRRMLQSDPFIRMDRISLIITVERRGGARNGRQDTTYPRGDGKTV